MTPQQIFTAVWNHFVRDGGERSADSAGRCHYRGENGARCAVGCLLSDEEAAVADGTTTSGSLSHVQALAEMGRLPSALAEHAPFLAALQRLHDNATNSEGVRTLLRTFATSNTFGVHAPEQES